MANLGVAGIVALLVLGGASEGSGQGVRGRILDEGAGTAVSGGFVRLVSGDGGIAASTLSSATGAYHLNAPAGTYFLRVERLGFRMHETGRFRLDSVVVLDIRVPQAAIEIPSIEARAEMQCGDGAMAGAAAAMWEEVRKVLAITAWTSQEGNVVFELESVRQQLDPRGFYVVAERTEAETSVAGGSPYVALAADSLIGHGFIQVDDAGTLTFFGPDAELVLSETFQNTHCFRAVTDRRKPGLIGLAFQPNDAIRTPDIRGTLWIDRESYELRSLDFSYTRLPINAPGRSAGGEILFTRLDNGLWILNQWTLTAPVMSTDGRIIFDRPDATPRADRGMARMLAVQRTIRRVVSAKVRNQLVYSAPAGPRSDKSPSLD